MPYLVASMAASLMAAAHGAERRTLKMGG